MEWSDQGLVLGAQKYGENDTILDILTQQNGRAKGFVKGGGGRRLRGVLQSGNSVTVVWRARLSTNLGRFTVESGKARAVHIYGDMLRLSAMNSLSSLLIKLLPEREAVENIYLGYEALLNLLSEPDATNNHCAIAMIKFEAGLLRELGFGLDLAACALTGEVENLSHVSPKSGRAVTKDAGEPYVDKLLPLPAFLLEDNLSSEHVSNEDIIAGFNLTGYFLSRHLLHPLGIDLPIERTRLLTSFEK
jgi:DNA repair protein RecO (recombination protein O)